MIKLTAADVRALRALIGCDGLVRPQTFGELLWPSKRKSSGNCSAPLARSAGKVLNRLRKAACAEYIYERDWWGWRVTPHGRSLIEKAEAQILKNTFGGLL